jgi:hypothetical protein
VKIIKYLPLILLVIVLLGCSLTVNVPTVNTDDTETYEISQPVPDNIQGAEIDIEMGGGRLNISSGSSQMVEGTVVYNVLDWKPNLSVTNNEVLISQNHTSNVGIPNGNIKNDWTLKLGSTPMSLRISAGAYAGVLDLSGVALTNLEISDGASQATVRFDTLNPADMQRLTYKTGASSVDLIGLGNVNTSQIIFDSGAGNYTLDFSGALAKDLNVKMNSGLSLVTVIIPKNTHTIVNLDDGLSNVDAEGSWTVSNSRYEASGSGSTITIDVEMAIGNLVLQQK